MKPSKRASRGLLVLALLQVLGYASATVTPDNTCGGANGYTCNPNDAYGGACCSEHGFCGYTADYCAAGCQRKYGSCFGASSAATGVNGRWDVPGAGIFTRFKQWTFEQSGSQLPAGLAKSADVIEDRDAPYWHTFEPANVDVQDGFMRLKVPGAQQVAWTLEAAIIGRQKKSAKKKSVKSAEVYTTESNILYASVRTFAMFSAVPGTCHGNFFYRTDRQETDIEYITDPSSKSNPGKGNLPLQYTNQALNGNPADATFATSPSPSDATTAVHEYRIDWVKGKTLFYLDGVLQRTFRTNVPSQKGAWVWNNWANGDKGFTVGPPLLDNYFKIQKIVMYYNVTA